MTEFEKRLILTITKLLEEVDTLQRDNEYWRGRATKLNELYEKLTNDYVTLSKSVRNE